MTPQLLTIKQAAIELGKTRQWVALRCKDGSIQNTTLGSRRYIPRQEINRILSEKEHKVTQSNTNEQ